MMSQNSMTSLGGAGGGIVGESGERLCRLENDRESLILQVSILTDQVEAQGDKIKDLVSMLKDKKDRLSDAEETIQVV